MRTFGKPFGQTVGGHVPSQGQKGDGRRILPLWLQGGVCVLLLGTSVCKAQGADKVVGGGDAKALVKKMVATYQKANSFQETSEAKINQNGDIFIQTCVIKYKKPNQLVISSQDPKAGTIAFFCNGITFAAYEGAQNLFTRRTAPKGMVAIVDVLPRAKLSQMLSPISFLAAKDLPREVTNFRFKGEQTIRGHKTLFVSCQGNAQFLESMKPVKEAVLEKGEFGLYIDPVTNLLVKAVGIIAWKVQLPAQGKQPAKVGRQIIIFEETHAGTVLNPPLKPEEFLFDPPKGAKEVFSESK